METRDDNCANLKLYFLFNMKSLLKIAKTL